MKKIVLSNGKSFEAYQIIETWHSLRIGLLPGEITFIEAAELFDQKELTKKIDVYDEDETYTLIGYTNMVQVEKDRNGGVIVALRKER